MLKKALLTTFASCFLLFLMVTYAMSQVPKVTGEPVIVQHLGKLVWPQDDDVSTPYLTQISANDINDLHGNLSCDLIISTPGNYHMALKDAMYGRRDLGHAGLLQQEATPNHAKVSICWSTSPPVSLDQITSETLQFKNIKVVGRPALAVAPGRLMKTLVNKNLVDKKSRKPLLINKGNVILVRADKAGSINNVCALGGETRVVTPNPVLEPGSFGNFSGTIFNVAAQNDFGCDATSLFNSVFSQDISSLDTSAFDNPYDINGVLSVFGRGSEPQGSGAKWVASSRIMHRDIPYALCHDEADAGVIFYHQAIYLKKTLAATGCNLDIVPLGGTVAEPQPLPGNKVGTLHIAKVNGSFTKKVREARDKIYKFLTTAPMWAQILTEHGLTPPQALAQSLDRRKNPGKSAAQHR